MAPAIQAATKELITNGRSDARKIIIYMGDGGGNSQPMQRDANGDPLTTPSWYTPTPGNNLRPCHDAVGQAAIAKQNGIEIFTIAYNINADNADTCYANNKPNDPADVEAGIDARSTLQQMATDANHYYEKPTPGRGPLDLPGDRAPDHEHRDEDHFVRRRRRDERGATMVEFAVILPVLLLLLLGTSRWGSSSTPSSMSARRRARPGACSRPCATIPMARRTSRTRSRRRSAGRSIRASSATPSARNRHGRPARP